MRVGRSVVVIAALAASAALAVATEPQAARARCPVTLPNGSTDPDAGFSAGSFNHGNARIRVHLNWSDGVLRAGRLPGGGFVAVVEPDGSIYTKLGWWRGVPGRFSITGRRLDRPAPPLRVSLHTASYPTIGFIPSGLTFPTTGCWRVTATQGVGRLVFVVMVEEAGLRPPERGASTSLGLRASPSRVSTRVLLGSETNPQRGAAQCGRRPALPAERPARPSPGTALKEDEEGPPRWQRPGCRLRAIKGGSLAC